MRIARPLDLFLSLLGRSLFSLNPLKGEGSLFSEKRIKVLLVNILIKILHSTLRYSWRVKSFISSAEVRKPCFCVFWRCVRKIYIFPCWCVEPQQQKKKLQGYTFSLCYRFIFPAWILKLSKPASEQKRHTCVTRAARKKAQTAHTESENCERGGAEKKVLKSTSRAPRYSFPCCFSVCW